MTDTERLDWLETLDYASFWKNKNNGVSFSPDDRVPAKMRAQANLRWAIDAAMEAAKCNAVRQEGPKCSDCPPRGYPTDKTRCSECPRCHNKGRLIAVDEKEKS